MVEVEIRHEADVVVSAPPAKAFALLSDVGRSGAHFPGLSRLDDLGSGVWRWTMKERGVGPIKIQANWESRYDCDEAAGTVKWIPAPGRHDMDSYGSWTVEAAGQGSRLRFSARTVARVPAPRMMRRMVETVAQEEIGKLKKGYVEAIAATLGL